MQSILIKFPPNQKFLGLLSPPSRLHGLTNQISTATNGKFDIVIFGATGFTGNYIAKECARQNSFSWTIAGRNSDKMRKLLQDVSLENGIASNTEIIVADCNSPQSLSDMARKAKVVINCAGPYRFYGEMVVKACVDNGTHYLDISGEPEFMEKIQLMYHELAETNGSYVVSSCGMDSVPVDVGILHFAKNFNGVVNFVETYMKLKVKSKKHKSFINYTTWESAVHGFVNAESLVQIRKKLYSKYKIPKVEPKIPRRPKVHLSPVFDNSPSIPFLGSDRSVAVRSQMYFHNVSNRRPIQCYAYLICETKLIQYAISTVFFFMQTLQKYKLGKQLLLNYPGLFSLGMVTKENPTEETLKTTSTEFRFYGEGWSGKTFLENEDPSTIKEPTNSSMITAINIEDSAYNFTSKCVIQCALHLLNETSKLPSTGGVYTPAAAFHRTNLLQALEQNGVAFKILKKE